MTLEIMTATELNKIYEKFGSEVKDSMCKMIWPFLKYLLARVEGKMNNRLDFIKQFEDEIKAVKEMTDVRRLFMNLDDVLASIMIESPLGHRELDIARTNIESALHYTIKALCLIHEKRV